MSRRRESPEREILPDPKYHSSVVAKFMNVIMVSGKKSIAEKIVYGAFNIINENDILQYFEKVLDNVRPLVEVRSKRIGGATYQVPIEVQPVRGTALAMRWLAQSARARGEKGMMARLAGEMKDAFEGKGSAVKKREDTHKMANANKAFAHFGRHH